MDEVFHVNSIKVAYSGGTYKEIKHDMEKVAVERAEEHIRTNLEEYLEKGVVK